MSVLVAEIDGRKVFSDKIVSVIAGARIVFTDGSWCNTATGQIHNAGVGSISIDSPGDTTDADNKPVVKGPQSFVGNALKIEAQSNMIIDVQPHDSTQIVVTLEGSAEALKNIKLFQEGGKVFIEGISEVSNDISISGDYISIGNGGISISGRSHGVIRVGGRISGSTIIGNNITMVDGQIISGNAINVSGLNTNSQVKVSVKVPFKTSVDISGEYEGLTIGDTEGTLYLDVDGTCVATIGSVRDTVIKTEGTTQVTIAKVTGSLVLRSEGTASIRVHEGQVTELKVKMEGTCQVNLLVQAQTADLKIEGTGNMFVSKVGTVLRRKVEGLGRITIGN
jgi:hypothetical protein